MSAGNSYPHLFSPLPIGNVVVPNRFAQSAHARRYVRAGVDSQRDLDYHVARARGGAGLLIIGTRVVHPSSSMTRFTTAFLERGIAADTRLTAAIHEHGTVVFSQLNHLGVNSFSDGGDDYGVLWGPSAVKSPAFGETAKEMDADDIEELIAWWARSAELQRLGGFDGVEIHLAHSYLLHQFLSPLYNRREDEYGGSLENRMRLPLRVIEAVRAAVGPDFVVGVRLNLSDFIDGAMSVDEAVLIAERLAKGDPRIDFINVTASGYHLPQMSFAPSDIPDGWLLDMSARIKHAVGTVPVFAVGGLQDPVEAERIVASGQADVVAMVRAQIADPDFVRKIAEGREREIYHCIRCNQACIGRGARNLPIGCTVNPATGRERRFGPSTLRRAESPGRWLVIGGGPAGMKAAEGLATRGHRVTLVDEQDALGGQIRLILRTEGRATFERIPRDLGYQLERLGVDVRLGTRLAPDDVLGGAWNGVICATGSVPDRSGASNATPLVARLPGSEQSNVVTARDVVAGTAATGRRVLVLDDEGTRQTAGAVERLLTDGAEVTLVTRFNALFPATQPTLDMPLIYARVLGRGLIVHPNTWVRRIDGTTATTFNVFTRVEQPMTGFDTFVLATGSRANTTLYDDLRGHVAALHRIGDCVAPRRLEHAIYEGFLAGRELFSTTDRMLIEGSLETEGLTETEELLF